MDGQDIINLLTSMKEDYRFNYNEKKKQFEIPYDSINLGELYFTNISAISIDSSISIGGSNKSFINFEKQRITITKNGIRIMAIYYEDIEKFDFDEYEIEIGIRNQPGKYSFMILYSPL